MQVMVIGADGQLGVDLVKVLAAQGEALTALTEADIDVCNPELVRWNFECHRPDVVLNTAVYHPVDDCELNPNRAFAVNALGARVLALAAREHKATLLHFSSDYVFDGEQTRPYRESDCPAPRSVFGASKVAGEQMIRATQQRHFIIRTSGLYGLAGSKAKGGNFVDTMLRLGREKGSVRVVTDQRMAQTSTRSLAEQVAVLIRTGHYGTFHASDHGDYSWYEFALKIFEYSGMDVKVTPVTSQEFPTVAPRPRYSVLENARLRALGLDRMEAIDVALQAYLRSRESVSAQGV